MRRTLAVLATAAVLVLTGCGPDDHRGDPGKVVDRERDYRHSSKTWDHDLTIRRPDGSTYELDVSGDAYDHCYRGSSYPKCVDR